MRLWHACSLLLSILIGGMALAADQAPTPASLRQAQEEARQATERSRRFEQAAAVATDQAARARAEAEALVARLQAAEAEITAAETRVVLVDAQLAEQRASLAERQGPLVRLLGALQSMSRRPPALALVQPGSLDDAVRVRAVLAATLPRIQARTAALRGEIDRTRTLRAQQDAARQALVASRAELGNRREALARLEADQRARSQGLAALALSESDRALALGEEAHSLERMVTDEAFQARLQQSLAALPGPVPRPTPVGEAPAGGPAFLLPADGRVLTGVGELNDAGVHARGLALAVEPEADVRAPAAGRVAFAGPFRSYGFILVLDHGGGWTSVITDLAAVGVSTGQQVARGATVGRARGGDARLTVELRFQGRPVPLTALLAA
jgi:murein hydrolase activator